MAADYKARVAALSSAARVDYEQCCGVLERECFGVSVLKRDALPRVLPASGEVRSLVAVHGLKLWLERLAGIGGVAPEDSQAVHDALGFVLEDPALANEIWGWVEELELRELPKPFRGLMPSELAARLEGCRRTFVIPNDRFEFVRQLNSRGMAVVVLVRHRRLAQLQVLKALHPELRENPVAVRQFRSEAKLLLQAAGPGIVRVIDCDESEGWPYFTMEYCPGGSLAERLVEGPLSQVQAAEQIGVIARSLHQVHRQHGLVHRDIKPANIFFPEDGRPALGDFGLARHVEDDLVHRGDVRRRPKLGTRGYIAPEILDESLAIPGEDDLQVWKRADVFSLGVTLYQCLTGRLPYQTGEGPIEIDGVLRREAQRPRELARVDTVLDAICMRAIRRDPRSRFSSVLELADELEKWVASNSREVLPSEGSDGGSGESRASSTVISSPVRWYSRPWAMVGAAALSIILFVGLTAWGTTGGNRGSRGVGGTSAGNLDVQKPQLTPGAARLVEAGWREDTAMALAAVTEPVLAVVEQRDPEFAARTWGRLEQLQKRVPDANLRQRPYLAGALIQPSFFAEQNQTQWLRILANEQDPGLTDDLLVRFADPDLLPEVVRLLDAFRPVLRSLRERDWVGAEQLLCELPEGDAGKLYSEWLRQVLQISDPEQCLEMLAVSLMHGQTTILPLLQRDHEFSRDFLVRIWPAFRDLTYGERDPQRRYVYYGEAGCWEMLKLDHGRELLDIYGPGVCEVFVGQTALPLEAQAAATALLLERRTAAIACLKDPKLRRNADFGRLLSRRLSENDLSALCALLLKQQDDGSAEKTAERLALLDDDLIRRELNRPEEGFLDRTPVVYFKIGWKAISGERIYPDEWARVVIQGLKDAATLASMGASAAVVPILEGFKIGLEAGDEAVQQARAELLARIKRAGGEQVTPAELRRAIRSPEGMVKAYVLIWQGVQQSIDLQRHERVFDGQRVWRFFVSASLQPREGRVALKTNANFLCLRFEDGFECCVPQLRRPLADAGYQNLLAKLTQTLMESGVELKPEERRLVTGQLLFAWLLLQHPEAAGFVESATSVQGAM
jgi:serine/threonine protein kinase